MMFLPKKKCKYKLQFTKEKCDIQSIFFNTSFRCLNEKTIGFNVVWTRLFNLRSLICVFKNLLSTSLFKIVTVK